MKVILPILISFFLLSSLNNVHAGCFDQPVENDYKKSDIVFMGRSVERAVEKRAVGTTAGEDFETVQIGMMSGQPSVEMVVRKTYAVSEVYKGDLRTHVIVNRVFHVSQDEFEQFASFYRLPGILDHQKERVIIFARRDPRTLKYIEDQCSSNLSVEIEDPSPEKLVVTEDQEETMRAHQEYAREKVNGVLRWLRQKNK